MRTLKGILIAICLLLPLPVPAQEGTQQAVGAELTGHWVGEGRIIVTWCEQKRLPYDLTIDAAGNVTGRIGDATLKNARLSRRTALMKELGNRTWLICGKLDGAIVASEEISREKLWLMFDPKGGHLEGSMNTSGPHIGGKGTMYMTVTGIVLNRMSN